MISRLSDVVDRLYRKFCSARKKFHLAKKIVLRDILDISDYVDSAKHRIVNESAGIRGIYVDMVRDRDNIYSKMRGMFSDMRNLDNPDNLGNPDKISSPVDPSPDDMSIDQLSGIIAIKNKYFYKNGTQLQDAIKKELGIDVGDVNSFMRETMKLKTINPEYSGIGRINYDRAMASLDMQDEFIRLYATSEKSLKDISIDMEKKYGMHISISTISRYSRRHFKDLGFEFKNRREARHNFIPGFSTPSFSTLQ